MPLGTNWSKYRKDGRNTGHTSVSGITIPVLNWVFNDVGIWSNVAIGGDNKIRFVGTDKKLYCIDNAGTVAWSVSPTSTEQFDSYSNIVLDDANRAYVGVKGWKLYLWDSDGTYINSTPSRIFDEPIGNIIFLSNGKLLYINNTFTATAHKSAWLYNSDLTLVMGINLISMGLIGNYYYAEGIPTIHNNYVAFVLSSSFNINDNAAQLAVIQIPNPDNISSLTVKWYETPYRALSFPAIDSSGYLYAIKNGDTVVKKDLEAGTTLFSVSVGSVAGRMAPSIDSDNNVYIVNDSNVLYSISSAGNINWHVEVTGLTGGVESPVSIDGGNNIYIAQGSKLLKYNSSGVLQWSFDLTGNAVSSPTIADSGHIYVPTTVGVNSIIQSASVQVSGYNLYRSTMPNVGFQKVNTEIITQSNYTDLNLSSGNYYYMVKAVSIMGVESEGATVIGPLRIGTAAPGKSKNLRFEVVNINNVKGIKLTWDAPLFNEDGTPLTNLAGYDVYRATIPQSTVMTGDIFGGQLSGAPFDQLSNFTPVNKINTTIVPTNTYTDFDVQGGFYYYYSVRAKNTDGKDGPYADEVRAALSIFKLVLKDGHNVVGFPFDDTTLYGHSTQMQVSEFINKIGINKVSKVMRWNENAQVYEQYPDFATLEATKGYVIILNTDSADTELDMNGNDWQKNINSVLKQKLNLIGLPLKDYTDVRALVNALGGSQNVEFIARFNRETQKYDQYVPAVDKGDFTTFEVGYGYYVFLKKSLTDKTINFAGSPWI